LGDPGRKQTDPRLLRADARYYVRVGKELPAAISFARAAVVDDQAMRSIESAVGSAAILRKLTKQAAAAELLIQVADRHSEEDTASDLILQAANILNETEPAPIDEIRILLQRCLRDWEKSDSASKARDWLIALEITAGHDVDAATIATEMPAVHWNETSSHRCRSLWLRAVVDSKIREPEIQDSKGTTVALQAMKRVFEEALAKHSAELLVQTYLQVSILLSDDLDQVLRSSELAGEDFFTTVARIRHSPNSATTHFPRDVSIDGQLLAKTLIWRIERDIAARPDTAKDLAAFLLMHFAKLDLSTMRWLIRANRIDEATMLMRTQMTSSNEPANWLRTAAITLSQSGVERPSNLKQAAKLWAELADGYPQGHPEGIAAQVESMACRFQLGDRRTVAAEAELILMTRPPGDDAQRSRLEAMVE
jgi:hypothetical protein